MSMLTRSVAYKPFQYPWAFEAFKTQNQLHWLPDEIPLADDVQDWNKKLTPAQRNLVTHIFRLFTQSDEEIGNAYIDQYMPRFKNNELRMMFLAFGNMEAIHMQSYSYLLDTIGMPETEYSAFLEYTEMRAKYELLQNYKMDTHHNTALSMAVFAAFTEGLQLFASFAMLMNFPRFNLMKNMGQIVTFSIRDETCMSDDTEVLTETGWKLFSDLDRTEKLAQFDGESNSITFANPSHYTAHHYKGDMVRLYRDQGAFDILCTPDHDIVLRYINKEHKKDRIIKKKAGDIKRNLYYFLPTAGHAAQEGDGISLHERFLIALQADGCMQSGNRYSGEQCGCLPVTFFLKKERKQERLEKLLADIGYDYTKSPSKSKGGFVYRVKVPAEKLITKNFEDWNVNLSEKSEDWFSGFIAEVAEWDGHWIKDNNGNVTGRIHYSTVNKQNASFVQTVASLCGWRVKVKVTEDNRKETYRDVHRVMMTPNEEWTRIGYLKTERVPYDGMVYCATMPKGTLITRRNNAIGFVGNCHVQSIMKLFHEYVAQFSSEIDKTALEISIRDACRTVVDNEDRFIDLAFEMGPVEGLDADQMKEYIRWIADMRLEGLGYSGMYHVQKNPLPWLDDMLNAVEHTNFFENRSTEYSRAATGGDWGDVFS